MADFPAFIAEKLKYNLAIGEALSCESNLTRRPYGKKKIRPSTLAEIFKRGCFKKLCFGLGRERLWAQAVSESDKLLSLGRRPAHWHRGCRGGKTSPFYARPHGYRLRGRTWKGQGRVKLADVSSLIIPFEKVSPNLIIILNVSLLRPYRVNKSLKDMVNFFFSALN